MHHKKKTKYSTPHSIKELNSWAGIKCKRRDLIFLKRQPQKKNQQDRPPGQRNSLQKITVYD